MQIIAIIGATFTLAMLIGWMWLCKWADAHWVMARKGNYRIHMVHGNMYHTWRYRLEKKGLLGWDTVGLHPIDKDDERYNEWIVKYKMRVLK